MAFHKFIKAMLNRKEIVMYGDGNQTRDFTFVDDVVDANILAMDADVVGKVFNLGGGSRVTVNQTIEMLKEIINSDIKVKYIKAQKGDVRHTAADITKARELLRYSPKVKLEDGLSQEVNWLNHLLMT